MIKKITSNLNWIFVTLLFFMQVQLHAQITRTEVESAYTKLVDTDNDVGRVSTTDHSGGASIILNDVGDKIRVTFSGTAESYKLRVRVRSGSYNTSSNYYAPQSYWSPTMRYIITVNGVSTTLVGDAATIGGQDGSYGGSYWGTLAISTINLVAGSNTIDIETSGSYAGVDYVEIEKIASETQPPSAITNLTTSAATQNSINLTWTAPGDNGNVGTASSYEIKYSNSVITTGNFASAILVNNIPVPLVAGTSQSMTVGGLALNTIYYFAMVAKDAAGNVSGISNIPTAKTLVPPGTFYRAINLNGSALTIDGNNFEASSTAANYSYSGITFANQAVVLNPTTDANRTNMIRSSISNSSGKDSVAFTISAVPSGVYEVYLYVWEDAYSFTYDVYLGGTLRTGYVSGVQGTWSRLSLGSVTVSNGLINVKTKGGIANLSGVEIWKQTSSDTTPPAAIANLTATAASSTSITLNWTAPGDDGNTGTATGYEVRYNTSAITTTNFSESILASGIPSPGAAGTAQTFTVTGLSPNVSYYFAIVSKDEVANSSLLSNVPTATTPPPAASQKIEVEDNYTKLVDPDNDVQRSPSTISGGATIMLTDAGDKIRVTFNATAESYKVRLWVRSGSYSKATNYYAPQSYWSSTMKYNIWVNGVSTPVTGDVSSISDTVGIYGGSYWGILSIPAVNLVAGSNTIDIETSASYAGVDYVEIEKNTLTDSQAPFQINTLTAVSTSFTTMNLSWVAPGDDGSTGTASSYELRYNTSPITDANFAQSPLAASLPVPAVAGTTQSYTLTGLQKNTIYYFAIKTKDEALNTSPLSITTSGKTLSGSFYRGININGEALAIDGNNWEAGTTATNFTFTARTYNDQSRFLTPSSDANRFTMIRSCFWKAAETDSISLTLSSVPNGVYDVYVYTWEDNSPQTISFILKASTKVVTPFTSVIAGQWVKLSLGKAIVTNGTINVRTGDGLISGVEIWKDDDTQAPATITNLAATSLSPSSIRLNWTAPGDDGTTGTATSYEIRYQTSAITNFPSATLVTGIPAPAVAGTAQTMTISGLSASTTYYFGIIAKDEAGNTSALATFPSATTQSGVTLSANAGSDRTLVLPTSSILIYGSATVTGATISGYQWTKVSGTGGTLSGANSATLMATSLTAGTYVFQLTITASNGSTNSDNMTVEVLPAPGSGTTRSFDYTPNYNGNISAVRWSSKFAPDPAQEKAYSFLYDKLNRLTDGLYAEKSTTGFTQGLGNYNEENISYDLNGNIQGLKRFESFKVPKKVMDDLTYKYVGNQLKLVNDPTITYDNYDNSFDDRGSKPADVTNPEYLYDWNGNLKEDKNKSITTTYNHLNLPERVDFGNNNYIIYTYDAAGTKLAKTVYASGQSPITTNYDGEFVFEGTNLQFISNEEGRVVSSTKPGEAGLYEYEYFLKDHLGNTRLVINSATPNQYIYTATMESENATIKSREEKEFMKVVETRYQNSANSMPGGDESARLNNNNRIGPSIALKVFPGDVIDMEVWAQYTTANTTFSAIPENIATAIAGAYTMGVSEIQKQSVSNAFAGISRLSLSDNAPKAYLNYIFLDKSYAYDGSKSGFKQVPTGVSGVFSQLKDKVTITKGGILYIFVANETNATLDVFFDNFKVTHSTTNIKSHTDYYPFGLTIAGLSGESASSNANRYLYNGIEFNDYFAINIYDARFRSLDPVLGRWGQVDPIVDGYESWSPYNSNLDNPVKNKDPDGDCPTCLFGLVVGMGVDYGMQVAGNYLQGKRGVDAWTDVDKTQIVISGLAGLATQGMSAIGGKTSQFVVGTAIDATESVLKQANTGLKGGKTLAQSVSLSQTVSDVVAEKLGGNLTKKFEKFVDTKVVTNELNRAVKVAVKQPVTSSGRKAAVASLEKKLNSKVGINKIAAQATQQPTGDVIQAISDNVRAGMNSSSPTTNKLIVQSDATNTATQVRLLR
jgi:RHS repeat-associated protein